MLLLFILCGYIAYRWTRRVATRTQIQVTKARFLSVVCLKMLWRLAIISSAAVIATSALSAASAQPSDVRRRSTQGVETGLALAIASLPVNLLIIFLSSWGIANKRYTSSAKRTPPQSPVTPLPPPTLVSTKSKTNRRVVFFILGAISIFILGTLTAIIFFRASAISRRAPNSLDESFAVAPTPQIVRGHELPYSIRLPTDWITKKGPAQFDVFATSKNRYIGIIAESANVGSPNTIAAAARENFTAETTDVLMTEPKPIMIDERQWLGFIAKCRVDKILLGYQYYVYAGPEGTFQILGSTTQDMFDREADSMRAIMQTFKFPNQSAANGHPAPTATLPAAEPSRWKRIVGRDLSYSIRMPPTWEVKRNAEDFDLTLGREAIRVGIVAEAGNVGSPEATADIARRRLADGATEIDATESQSIMIDGRTWLQFIVKCKVDAIPLAYQFYVYAGADGTYQIIGWTIQNLFERDAAEIRAVMQTFRFPNQ